VSPTSAVVAGPASTEVGLTPQRAFESPIETESLLDDLQFVRLVRWVFTARLVCLALAAPAALSGPAATLTGSLSLCVLTASSLVFSRSDRLIRTMIRHPLLASMDVSITLALLVSIDAGQPAALTVICSALVTGLLFPRRVLVLLLVPLVIGSFGAPANVLVPGGDDWRGWLALVAGLPALVLGVCVIGSVVRRSVQAMIQARREVTEAMAAVGAADERARLAREMHDSVGKSLHGISLGAKALRRVVERDAMESAELGRPATSARDPALAARLAASLAESADQAAREARLLLVTLRRGQPDRPTLDVIAEILAEWPRPSQLEARLSTVQVVDASSAVTRQLAAALTEILHNITKHARATDVDVVLKGGPRLIELIVTDNGVGFDTEDIPGALERAGHFGLRGLRERAADVGGEVEILSSAGKGTRVRWTALRHP
jgi:signal transduction histidine kinase